MAKNSLRPPPAPSSEDDSSSEGSSSSDEEQPTGTKSASKPAPPTPTKNKDEEESDDESESESDEESADDEGEGEEKEDSKKPQASASTLSTKPAAESAGSESESDDDESDSDSEAAKLVTPISSKPMAEVTAKKEKANPMAEVTVKEDKTNGKAAAFQRIWSLEDEIAILRGLAQFQSEKGPVKLNIASIGGFYDIIKKKLSLEVTSSQLVEKLRRLKKRYVGIAARAECGKPPQSAHDGAVYELGKKIWAEDDESVGRGSKGMETNIGGASLNEKVGSSKDKFPFLKGAVKSMGKRYANEALEMLDVTKADALDKKLKKQRMAEMKHSVQEVELLKETLKLIMEGMERATS